MPSFDMGPGTGNPLTIEVINSRGRYDFYVKIDCDGVAPVCYFNRYGPTGPVVGIATDGRPHLLTLFYSTKFLL